MSCHGSRRTPLFQLNVDHVINFDDFGGPPNPFRPHVEVFARVWTWELSATIARAPRCGGGRGRGWLYIPRVGTIDYSVESFPPHQYSGDFTERTDEDRLTSAG